jgi:pimeloyl-ACP methyl ester carboxylesterase
MKDIPERLTDIPAKLTGSFIRHFLKDKYRRTLFRLCRGEKELPEGQAQFRTVIFHGFSKHSDTPDMQKFRHNLQHKGRSDLFYLDLPYHGLSEPNIRLRGKIRHFSRLVESVFALTLKALARPADSGATPPVILIGYSTGALAIMRFLQLYPELQKYIAGVVFVSVPLRLDHKASALVQKYKKYLERFMRWASYLPYVEDIPIGDIGVGDLSDELEYNDKIGLRSAMELHMATIDARRNFDKITVPCLFLHGAKDGTAPVGDAKDAYNLVLTPAELKEIVVYSNAEHGLLDEQKSRLDITEDILKWMERVRARAAWMPVEHENLMDDTMELTSDTFFFLRRRLAQVKKILLRWIGNLAFWNK